MRLIDADALMEQYNLKDATKYENKNAEQQVHSYSTLMLYEIANMIEDAPTAYDVDKVVEQLEELKTINVDISFETIIRTLRKDVVLEIVKGGGVDGEIDNKQRCVRNGNV